MNISSLRQNLQNLEHVMSLHTKFHEDPINASSVKLKKA